MNGHRVAGVAVRVRDGEPQLAERQRVTVLNAHIDERRRGVAMLGEIAEFGSADRGPWDARTGCPRNRRAVEFGALLPIESCIAILPECAADILCPIPRPRNEKGRPNGTALDQFKRCCDQRE